MSTSHPWISQTLYQRYVRLECVDLLPDFLCNLLTSWDVFEVLVAFEYSLECVANVLFKLFWVYGCKWVIHPAIVPFLPV